MLETTFTHKCNTTFLVNGFTSFPWACASCPPCSPCHKNPENLINIYSVSTAKAAFYGCLTERHREKGVRSRTTMPGERFSGCFASLQEEQTIEPVPPPLRRFHKLIAYYVACQGEIRVFFLFLALFLCHILENILRQIPHAGICIWTWLSLATQNTWNWTLQGSHNSIFTIFTVTRETWKMLVWC